MVSIPAVQTIRGYTLRERLGEGGFGIVYRAEQSAVGREVAIKVILPQFANHPDFIRRFEVEAQLIAHLEHPYIVPLYDYWREPDGAYLVMRYLRGGNLRASLQAGAWSPENAARLLDQVASALGAAHRQGVVHRDVKPANVLLDEEGNAFLSDFGIAKDVSHPSEQTETGVITGSLAYISPEQAQSRPVSAASDLYSLGVVMYEVLTGEHPFPGEAPTTQLLKHLTEPLPSLQARRPELPGALNDVIQRATAKDPSKRYPSALDFALGFRAAIGEAPSDVTSIGATPTFDLSAPLEAPNPYKGLRAFQEADADDFFGREALIQQLLFHLSPALDGMLPIHESPGTRFLAVVGPSGSGKSSVVKAGLIPALRGGALPGSEKWFILGMTPASHPLEELEIGLLRLAASPLQGLMEQLRRDERGLSRAVRLVLPDEESEFLLVVDQFEEVFTLAEDKAEASHFLKSLNAAVNDPHSRVRVIVTLRADFYDRPLMHPEFSALMQKHTEVVVPLTADELVRAIQKPAEQAGAVFEDGLAAAIVTDVKDQPGALPLLQYALTELFERRAGHRLTREAYQSLGGVLGVLGRRAEEVYAGLDPAGQAATRQICLRLVMLGEGTEDTRRRALRSELLSLGEGQGESLIETVIEAFGRARLLSFDHDPVTRSPTVEVAHEALLREWPRLHAWLDAGRSDVRQQRLLASAAAEWLKAGRDPSFLLRGARLSQFEGWAASAAMALTQEEHAFLQASLAERQVEQEAEAARQRRELEAAQRLAEAERQRAEVQTRSAARLRQRAVYLSIALILAGVLAVVALVFARQANENTRLATSRELASAAITNLQVDPERSVLLALQALEQAETLEARNALHQALQDLHIPLNLPWTSDYSRDGTRYSLIGADHSVQVVDANAQQTLFSTPGSVLNPAINTWFSPDGKRLFIAHADNTVEVLDANTGQAMSTIPTGLDLAGFTAITIRSDGRYLGILGITGTIRTLRVWDISTNQEVFAQTDPEGGSFTTFNPLGNIAFSPGETEMAIANFGGVPKVWSIATGQELFTLSGHTAVTVFIAYSPDGKLLATASDDNTARVWDAVTGEELFTLSGHTARVECAVFSPDGTRLATASNDHVAKIWDLSTGEEIFTLTGHNGGVTSAVFSPDGTILASGGDDGQVKLWEVASGQELLNMAGHTSSAYVADFSQDGTQLITFGDETLKVWELSPGQEALTLVDTGYFVAYSPDGTALASGGDYQVKIWDATSGEAIFSLPIEAIIMEVAFSPDGRQLAVAVQGGTAEVWDLGARQKTLTISVSDSEHWVTNIAYSPDGKRLATASTDGLSKVWDAVTGQELLTLAVGTQEVWGIAFNPNGTYLATAGRNGVFKVWDLATGQELLNLPGGSDVFSVAFSPDGKVLAIGNNDGLVKMWEVASGKELPSLSGHTGIVYDIAFSSDGKWLASASWDGTIKVWEAATGKEWLTLTGNTAKIGGIAFSPDGTRLASAAWDETVRVYLLRTDELVALARSRITRSLTTEECQKYLHHAVCP